MTHEFSATVRPASWKAETLKLRAELAEKNDVYIALLLKYAELAEKYNDIMSEQADIKISRLEALLKGDKDEL